MPPFNFSSHLKDYRQCQKRLGQQISAQMLEIMSRREMMAAAKKLHMAHKGIVMCAGEEESNALTEFALFSHLHPFGSVALRWCNKHKDSSSALDERIMAGIRESFYSVFRVVELCPCNGLLIQDVYTKKEFPMMDIGTSRSATVNMGLASRVIPIRDWGMFTGAIIPVVNQTYHALEPYLQKNLHPGMVKQNRPFSGKKEMLFQATVIRTAMANGGFENVAYEDI